MKPVSIMHIADMHLGTSVSAFNTADNLLRRQELEYTCINALKSAHKYDIVLIPGDVFDSPDCTERVADMFLSAVSLAENTHFFYSCGNHDPYISPIVDYCVQNCPPNLHIFGPEFLECVTLEELGVRVYGISFSSSHQTVSLISDSVSCDRSYTNLLCMHGELAAAQDALYNPISLRTLELSGFDYAALGHVHSFSGICRLGNLMYAYCGIPEPRGFDESGDKGCVCAVLADGCLDLKFIPLAKRRYIDVSLDISDIRDYPSLISAISDIAVCRDDIYRITLCGQNHIAALTDTELLERHVDAFYIKITDSTHPAYDISVFADDLTLKGMCARETLRLLEDADDNAAELYSKACGVLFDLFDSRGDEYDN